MSSESNYSVTFVQGKPAMVTVRGDTADEWKANLDDASQSGALAEIRKVQDELNGVRPALQPAAAKAEPDQELPDSFGVKCSTCGAPAEFVQEGTSKQSGKPYKRYRCTANQIHKATFTN